MNVHPVDEIHDKTAGRGVDIAFEAVGHAVEIPGRHHPLRECIGGIRGAGTVCTLGLGNDPIPILPKELIWKEGRLLTSRVSHGEFQDTIDHMAAGQLNPDAMISAQISASRAQEAFESLENEPEKHLKILLRVSPES
jgi:threonine dehydrogenase-like Zn-dependent dehydrogenase